MGNMQVDPMTANHSLRVRQRSTLGPSTDGNHYSIVHVTGYIKNWPPSGMLLFFYVFHMIFGDSLKEVSSYVFVFQDKWDSAETKLTKALGVQQRLRSVWAYTLICIP